MYGVSVVVCMGCGFCVYGVMFGRFAASTQKRLRGMPPTLLVAGLDFKRKCARVDSSKRSDRALETSIEGKARSKAEQGRRHAAKRFYCEGRAAARVSADPARRVQPRSVARAKRERPPLGPVPSGGTKILKFRASFDFGHPSRAKIHTHLENFQNSKQ